MNDKITINPEELSQSAGNDAPSSESKIVICEVPVGNDDVSSRPPLPWAWYALLAIPVLNILGVVWAFWQRTYRFRGAAVATCCSLVLTFAFGWSLLSRGTYDSPRSTQDSPRGTYDSPRSTQGSPRGSQDSPRGTQDSPRGPQNSHWKNELALRAKSGGVVKIVVRDNNAIYTGTGVVIARSGEKALILTNRHVVLNSNDELARNIIIKTSDGTSMQGKILALPKQVKVDMALVGVQDVGRLEVLGDLGNYDRLKTGDDVVAIGHPEVFDFTMTEGIVSALRDGMLIQTSAPINHGNSGGPLLDTHGNIIGINTFSYKNCEGLHFAFRADYVLRRSEWRYFVDLSPFLDQIKVN